MRVVWVNGCFDVLHRGHIELFKFAKEHGEFLVVGIDTDTRVSKMKGPSRPFNNQKDRKFVLESIKYIDQVVYFNTTEQLEQMIKLFEPDIMVVGSDWRGHKVIGSENAKKLIYFDRIEKYSTTKILEGKNDVCI